MAAVFTIIIVSMMTIGFLYYKRNSKYEKSVQKWRESAEIGDKARMTESDLKFNFGKISKINKDGTFVLEFIIDKNEVYPPFKK